MNKKLKYEAAKDGATALAALYLLESCATTLEQVPFVDKGLQKSTEFLTREMRTQRDRMLGIFDKKLEKAGMPRP